MASLLARTVHFIVGGATLLSGGLDDCLTPFDSSCKAGIANLDALMRNLTSDEPTLLLPFIDRGSPFVQMHPLSWAVNRLIYQGMLGLEVFAATPSLLQQHKSDGVSSRDLSFLQTSDFPFLLSNAAVSPGNSWSAYHIPLYLDEKTGLAVISIINDGELYNVDQIESTIGLLNDIERFNRQARCYGDDSDEAHYAHYDSYFNKTKETSTATQKKCWIPVVVYSEVRTSFESWFKAVSNHDFPPALVVNIEEKIEEYSEPTLVEGVWVVSYELSSSQCDQVTLQIAEGGRSIEKVEYVALDMKTIPNELKDSSYVRLQSFLRQLATEAAANDPVVGMSVEVPVQRTGTYRRCKAGMCETGNLYSDAIRWYTKSDIAFQSSGGFRGNGWAAGEVKTSDIWAALPFDNDLCTGVISGASMFQLFNHSLYYSIFEGENTRDGGLLLQVSGMRLSFNLQLPNTTRIVNMEIWDEETGTYTDVERSKLYSFATDSYICSGYDNYPVLLGEDSLVGPGEVPGFIGDTPIVQSVVADYLAQFQESPYDPSAPGNRLVNRTDILEPLNFFRTEDDCLRGEFWETKNSTCVLCPNAPSVAILSEQLELDAEASLHGSIKLVNVQQSSVDVLVKSLPSYVSIVSVINESGETTNFSIFKHTIGMLAGESLTLNVTVDFDMLEAGTAQGSVVLGVIDVGSYSGCPGRDVTLEVFARKFPPEELNQLGNLRFVGFVLAFIACSMALAATAWVFIHRDKHVVKLMQPVFLNAISLGIFIMALAMIPTSIDDEIASQEAADAACMAIPWLLSIGFTISMSALFSKLWRIHRLFSATRRGRRVQLMAKHVIAPFAVMFLVNVSMILTWTLWSPRKFIRVPMPNEPWNSYGKCQSEEFTLGNILLMISMVANVSPLAAASYMAYRVRKVSDEFSEAKRVGLGLFIWVQFVVVGCPMYFLIKSDNPAARYFLETGAIFIICVSMLSLIFVPIIWNKNQHSVLYARPDLQTTERNAMSETFTGAPSPMPSIHKERTPELGDRNRWEQYSLRDKGPQVTGVHWDGPRVSPGVNWAQTTTSKVEEKGDTERCIPDSSSSLDMLEDGETEK